MNIMLIAAILGFLWIEMRAVNKAMKLNKEKFNIGYYMRNNAVLLLMNAVGTVMIYLSSPLVTMFLRWAIGKWVEDAEVMNALSDYLLAPLTGAVIGLLGAKGVRRFVDRAEKKGGSPANDENADDTTP